MGVGQQDSSNRQQDNGAEDWDALRGDVSEMAGAAVERGRFFIAAAREQATDYVDRRKGDVAQSVADFATTLRESTRSFDERPNIRAVVDSAAEGLEQLAESIRARRFRAPRPAPPPPLRRAAQHRRRGGQRGRRPRAAGRVDPRAQLLGYLQRLR